MMASVLCIIKIFIYKLAYLPVNLTLQLHMNIWKYMEYADEEGNFIRQ